MKPGYRLDCDETELMDACPEIKQLGNSTGTSLCDWVILPKSEFPEKGDEYFSGTQWRKSSNWLNARPQSRCVYRRRRKQCQPAD